MLLGLQIPYSATFVGAFVAVLTRPDCQYPWRVLAVLEFVQVGRAWQQQARLAACLPACCACTPSLICAGKLMPRRDLAHCSGCSSPRSCCSCWRASKT